MATKGTYFPVDPEDRSSRRLLEDRHILTRTEEDIARSSNKQNPGGCKLMSMWTFSLLILGMSVMFLVGICLGFYVRELQTSGQSLQQVCGSDKRSSLELDKLGALHETLVYYVRGESIREFVSNTSSNESVTGSLAERRLANVVLSTLDSYRLDFVDVEEHEITVTHSDPERPNILTLLHQAGAAHQTFVLQNVEQYVDSSRVKDTHLDRWKHPHVVFSPSGSVQADLVYGHYGLETDFVTLQALGVDVQNTTILLRLGKISVADKVINSQSYGVKAVILYWEPQDVKEDADFSGRSNSYIPYESAATYISEGATMWNPSILTQTVSADIARVLLSVLSQTNGSVPAPASWTGSLAAFYAVAARTPGSCVVQLSTFNKQYLEKIQNIISTIQGVQETDRYVIVGAPRSSLPGQSQDAVASTAALLELAHSFHYVHHRHHWKPRRSIKFISWGGFEYSQIGMLSFIKNHYNYGRAVAYFDISKLAVGNDSIVARIPPALHQLIQETTFDIPDPRNSEQTLRMSLKLPAGAGEDNSSFSQHGIISVESFDADTSHNPFLHILGVPEVKVKYIPAPGVQKSVGVMTAEELGHHYKFHATVMHVLTKSLLVMLDNELLPFNLLKEVQALQSTLWQTLATLEQCSLDVGNLYTAAVLSKNVLQSARSFQEVSQMFVNHSDHLGVRMVNDVRMSIQKLFLLTKGGHSRHILYPVAKDGSLVAASDLCQVPAVDLRLSLVREFVESLASLVNRTLALCLPTMGTP